MVFKGSDGISLGVKKIEKGKSISFIPKTPKNPEFTFKGWYTTTSLTGTPYDFDTAVTRNFTLYAKFVKLFIVTFKDIDGSITEDSQEVESGNKVTIPTTIPTKAEHTFKNWYTTMDFSGTPYDFDTPVSKDLTLYAKFVEFFTITFKILGGSTTENSQKIESGSKAIRPTTDPTKIGYDFVNWYISNDPKKQTTAFKFDNTPITENTILYTKWLIKTYSITFHTGSNSNKVNDKTADHNTTTTAPKSPTKAGHTFNGWYTTNNPQAQMREFDFKNTPITENITLYAKWQINTYTITFYTEPNASRVNDKTTTYNTIITAPKNPTKTRDVFKDWYTTINLSGIPYNFGAAVTRNFTLYAKFVELFTVTFKTPNGSTTEDSQSVELGSKAILPTADPTKNNFAFKGWYITKETNGVSYDFDTPVSKNFTLYAKFLQSFTVTFDTDPDGSTVSPQNIALNDSANLPTNNPTRDNFVFKGWYIIKNPSEGVSSYDFSKPIIKNLTLYAKWKATNEDTPMAKACSNGIMPDINTADFKSIKSMLEPLEVTVGTALTCLHFSNTGADSATGKDWNHAFSTKQLKTKLDGITDASSNKVYLMLLSKGTYKSTTGADRTIFFVMKNYTAIIGGWNNNYDYDVKTNISLLSGDIGIENEKSDNSYHIIFNKGNNLTTTAILYGVTLSYSNANGTGKTHTKIGGAIYNYFSNPTISQSIFSKNHATEGGAIYNYFSNPTISQSTFSENTSTIGGAISNTNSNPMIIQSSFNDNNTASSGGAISNINSNPMIIQSSFSNNKGSYGGAIYNGYSSSPKIIQSSFSNNTANQSGGAIYSYLSSSKIIQSSFSNNTSNQGGAIYQNNDGKGNTILANVVFWGNSLTGTNASGSQIYLDTYNDKNENITLGSVVLEGGTDSIGFYSSTKNRKKINEKNIITINPNLEALSDNGGVIQTLAISSGSSAINKGLYIKIKNDYSIFYYSDDKNSWYSNPNLETAVTLPATGTFDLATDGRGYTFSGKPDIGSYEYGGTQ